MNIQTKKLVQEQYKRATDPKNKSWAFPQFSMVKRISCLCSPFYSNNLNLPGGPLILFLLTPEERETGWRKRQQEAQLPSPRRTSPEHLHTKQERQQAPAAAASQAASHLFHCFTVMHGEITSRDFYTFRKGHPSRSKDTLLDFFAVVHAFHFCLQFQIFQGR